jgi:tetratricopeptide (TPR) repeat protein
MKTYPLIAVVLFLASSLLAQEEFEKLSAKERIDIADRERLESKNDVAFQQLMNEGHELFEEKHYLKAIRAYEKAARQRPYNVYPKVIIADIELSMKDTLATLRAVEKEEKQKKKERNLDLKEKEKKENPEPDKPENTVERLDEWEEMERKKREAAREAQKAREKEPQPRVMEGDVERMSVEDFRKELGEQYPSGITETVREEGNKVITTRIVVRNGKGDEYKKVEHNWGGIFYFKNGDAVTERVWKKETVAP